MTRTWAWGSESMQIQKAPCTRSFGWGSRAHVPFQIDAAQPPAKVPTAMDSGVQLQLVTPSAQLEPSVSAKPEPAVSTGQEPAVAVLVTPSRGSLCAHVHMTQENVHVPATGSALEPGWDSRKKSETYFPVDVWDRPEKPPYVHVVNTAAGAKRAMQLLRTLVEKDAAAAKSHAPVSDYGRKYWSRRIFACDTEVWSSNSGMIDLHFRLRYPFEEC